MSELKKSGVESRSIQAFEFPSADPSLITIAATGVAESTPVFTKTGMYRITTDGAIQAVKDAVPSVPSASAASTEFIANSTEYMGISVGDTISVIGSIGTKVKFGLMD